MPALAGSPVALPRPPSGPPPGAHHLRAASHQIPGQVKSGDGYVRAPYLPGIGVDLDSDLIRRLDVSYRTP